MEIEPYSIFYRHRPYKIAFLVNPASGVEWVDLIVKYNRDKWGGRFNPVIYTDGTAIAEDWWGFLKGYDPDVICSTVSLTDDLRKKIHVFLSPLRVLELNPENRYISIDDYPISIFPSGKNVAQIGMPLFDDKNNLIIFEVDESTPEIIRTFLDRNFGLLEQDSRMVTYPLKKALETCQVKKYRVTDEGSLNEALLDLGEWRTRAVFPAQICALPNTQKESDRAYDDEKFEIIIGDTIDEVAYAWNRTLKMGAWLRTYITHIWIPQGLADSATIKPGLGKFINRHVASVGHDHTRGAHFVTFSLREDEVKVIADSFNTMIHHHRKSTRYAAHPMPNYTPRTSHFFLRTGTDFHRAHSNEEHLVLNEPDLEQGTMGGEHWFTDLYIQYRPERFKNIIGRDYWWQLPRRNGMLRDLQIFNKAARINESGMFSVQMRRRSNHPAFPDDNGALIVKIPDDRSVFHALLCGESFDCIERGDRERYLSRPFYHLRRSDKGMYLSGVLGLFPDLLNAHRLFEERFWRRTFEKMSNQNPEKDAGVQQELLNRLTKKINSGMDLKGSARAKEWLAHNVLVFAKKYSKEEVDLDYPTLRDLAKAETDEYNAKPSGQTIEFSEDDFKDEISDMVEMNILLLGVKPRCPKCGYRIWYQINDVGQHIKCRGCGYEYALPAEPEWFYRLNSLIRAAVSLHGTVPLLITLGQVMGDARSSAMFMPSTELLRKSETQGDDLVVYGELDLVCIRDGQFVIGEIKQSIDLFHPDDFSRMKEVAMRVRPDVIIFSSMDKEPNQYMKDNIQKLGDELADLEIKVEWYPIHYWAFTAHPVR